VTKFYGATEISSEYGSGSGITYSSFGTLPFRLYPRFRTTLRSLLITMKILRTSKEILDRIHKHGEGSYPEEGAGLLLGEIKGESSTVYEIIPLTNAREESARHNRYLITPQDMLRGEREAMQLGFDIIGVFHSHPDHPSMPSEFDREWALPNLSYVITSVKEATAIDTRSWVLTNDRKIFEEQKIKLNP
jgi:proteasome lid subunit RPN8/RPN11